MLLLRLLLLLLLLLRIATHTQSTDVGQMLQVVDDLLQRHSDREDAGRWHRSQQLAVHTGTIAQPVVATSATATTITAAAATTVPIRNIGEHLELVWRWGWSRWPDVHRGHRRQGLELHIHR
uniref:Putative secreted protein n=1 Tax=Anopheles triannulatus TaxID=58253 RepID=A0A2M4B399_9DIPT